MKGEAEREELDGLLVLALGPLPEGFADLFAAALSRRVAVPCRSRAAPEDMDLPRLAHRDQLDADRLLARLEALPRPPQQWIVGLTALDLGHPIFTFFFGRARHHGGAALCSTARLAQGFYGLPDDPALLIRRAVAEALHELGHLAGLEHCPDNACVMRFVANVEGIDNRGDTFCATCARSLPAAFRPSRAGSAG